jgi:hypothetical protein
LDFVILTLLEKKTSLWSRDGLGEGVLGWLLDWMVVGIRGIKGWEVPLGLLYNSLLVGACSLNSKFEILLILFLVWACFILIIFFFFLLTKAII